MEISQGTAANSLCGYHAPGLKRIVACLRPLFSGIAARIRENFCSRARASSIAVSRPCLVSRIKTFFGYRTDVLIRETLVGVRARICSPIGSKTVGAGPSGFGSARGVPLALPRCTLRRCNLNRGAPSRLQRCRSFSSASSHRTRAWRQRDRDRLPLWSERSA